MKKTYAQVVKQIETLQQEADKLRRQEVEGVVARIREAVQHYGLTAADLGLAPAAARKTKAAGKPVAKTRRKSAKTKAKPAQDPDWENE